MITNLTLQQIADITKGQIVVGNGQSVITSISNDTRKITQGALYVALRGNRFDGHEFVAQALANNAAAALVDTIQHDIDIAQVQVQDTMIALGDLGGYNRSLFTGPVVSVTGSAGKTSVKQLMASVLAQKYNTLMTQGNLNNEVGAPLTLLAISPEHQAAVIELGASGLGEIAYTAKWVKPQVGIITNAAEAHIEGFGSLAGVVQTKGELIDFIQSGGTAVLNADDPHFAIWKQRAAGKKILSFGFSESADVRATDIDCSLKGGRFTLNFNNQAWSVNLPLLGEHNIRNALAVAAAAFALGLSATEIVSGLESAQAVAGRLQWLEGQNGQQILNDAYNANPASVRAAIDVLKVAERSWLVLGDMAELGPDELTLHAAVGAYARTQGIQHLLATGERSKNTTDAFGAGAHWFATKEDLVRFLQQETHSQDVILVKGSRSAGMDQVVTALQKQTEGN